MTALERPSVEAINEAVLRRLLASLQRQPGVRHLSLSDTHRVKISPTHLLIKNRNVIFDFKQRRNHQIVAAAGRNKGRDWKNAAPEYRRTAAKPRY